jgi:hypothetical protein
MPNRTPPGRKAECISACHLAEMAINDEKTGNTGMAKFYKYVNVKLLAPTKSTNWS